MTNSWKGTILPLDLWEVELLRLTVFPNPGPDTRNNSWWREIAGEEPEERLEQPKLGISTYTGKFADGVLLLAVRPSRVDWRYQGAPSLEPEGSRGIATAGRFQQSLRLFVDAMSRWMDSESYPSTKRIALGAVLLHQVSGLAQGNELLARYLHHVELDVENSRDFAFQINRPRKSRETSDLEINRLSKWSVVTLVQTEISMPQLSSYVATSTIYGRVELDLNTAVNFEGEFDGKKSRLVLTELSELAEELLREGDIP